MNPPSEVTRLLTRWSDGDPDALGELVPLVERELRRLARHYMRGEQGGHLLQTTDLVNEAYIRLIDQRHIRWQGRAHFFGIAAHLMRRVLVDHARRQLRNKRGGGSQVLSLEEATVLPASASAELLRLDEALKKLAESDSRKSRVVELRYFGGLSVAETAKVLNVSEVTVMRDWHLAKAWLKREVSDDK